MCLLVCLTLSTLLAVLTVGCAADGPPRTEALAAGELRWGDGRAADSLVLIVNDTMRRDRMGIHGGPARTPAFDGFARDHLLFERAYANSPWTKPSMATLFTSQYPSQHGVVSHPSLRRRREGELRPEDAWMDVMTDEFTTLAEVLQQGGLRTAAFVGNPWMRAEYGFAQGFERYDDSFAGWDVAGEVVARAGLRWLATVGPEERFFLYLHTMDTHRPYGRLSAAEIEARRPALERAAVGVPGPVRDRIARLVFLEDGTPAADAGVPLSPLLLSLAYDRGVERFDEALRLFLDAFSGHPAFERTAVVVTSDHGEALFSRGYGNHGAGLYEDEVAVPLAARLPGLESDDFRVRVLVGLVDLFPTLVRYLGVGPPEEGVFGRDWLAPAEPGRPLEDRYLVTEGVMFRPRNRAVRHRGYKLLWQPDPGPLGRTEALFRVADDPLETRDLLGVDGSTTGDGSTAGGRSTAGARARLEALLAGAERTVPEYGLAGADAVPLDPETARRLRALGYLR